MFVVDATALLPHPPHAVLRVVSRLDALPRWCTGLRRARHLPAAEYPPVGGAPAACVLVYQAAEVRLVLAARTLDEPAAGSAGHVAEGDGVRLTWRFTAAPELAAGEAGVGRAPGGVARTRLHVRIALEVDPTHATAERRAPLCRLVARRAASDIERLRALLDRYEYGRRPAAPVPPELMPHTPAAPPDLAPAPGGS